MAVIPRRNEKTKVMQNFRGQMTRLLWEMCKWHFSFFYIPFQIIDNIGWRVQVQRLNDTTQWSDHLNWDKIANQTSMILPVFERPWLMVQVGSEPFSSHLADSRSPNWANQAVASLGCTGIILGRANLIFYRNLLNHCLPAILQRERQTQDVHSGKIPLTYRHK